MKTAVPHLPLSFAKKLVNALKSSGRRGKDKYWRCPNITVTAEDLQAIYKKQEGKCYWSGFPLNIQYNDDPHCPLAISVDRLDVASKDGTYNADNVVLCIRLHNLGRGPYSKEGYRAVMETYHNYVIRDLTIKEDESILVG